MLPAWGTPPPPQPFTVVGFYGLNDERFLGHVMAAGAREAEDLAQMRWGSQRDELGDHVDLMVCAVFAGHLDGVDDYATFLNPDEH
jgi:hypothetical protein